MVTNNLEADGKIDIVHVRKGKQASKSNVHEETNVERINENTPDSSNGESFSYVGLLYSIVIFIACFMTTSTFTWIPMHDHFIHPEFWWEQVLIKGFIFMILRIVLSTIREMYSIFQDEEINTFKWHLKLYAVNTSLYILLSCFSHFIWTLFLNRNPPMPFGELPGGMLGWYITIFVLRAVFFPAEKRKDPDFKNRLNNYVYYLIVWSLIPWQELFMDGIFTLLTSYDVQFLMALVIPLFRSFVEWILPKFFNKACGYKKGWTKAEENEPAAFCLETQIAQAYSMYIAVRLTMFSPENLTTGCILGVECLINLYHCFQIIRIHNKIGANDDNEQNSVLKAEKKSALVSLITLEFIEASIPLIYAMGLFLAYYGPNAKLMIGIKSEYFGVPPITDLPSVLSVLFLMAGIDALGGILVGVLLGYFCKINIIKELSIILQKYWIHLSIFMGGEICNVSMRNA